MGCADYIGRQLTTNQKGYSTMTNEEINKINEDQAVADDLAHRREIFKQNFSIDALLYLKYGELNRKHSFENEAEYLGRVAAEAKYKHERVVSNLEYVKTEIKIIEEVIAEKQAELKARHYRND